MGGASNAASSAESTGGGCCGTARSGSRRVYQNFVLWVDPAGKQAKGPDLPDRVIEVTMTDRDHFLQQFPEELRATAEGLPFAPLKPPFENPWCGPGWFRLAGEEQAGGGFDPDVPSGQSRGSPERVLVLPSRQGHVIAVGDTLVLVAEQWKEGVRLMQVRIPR